jgi:hypothetical protein
MRIVEVRNWRERIKRMDREFLPNSNRWMIYKYIQALDSGKLDDIEKILQKAQNDAELDHMIGEINQEYASELGLTPLAQASAKVQELLEEYFNQEEIIVDSQPLTVGDVAARMIGDQELLKAHREIGKTLLKNPLALPEWLNLQAIRQIGVKLKLADERFLRAFRDTALQMMMGRGQAQMAATRAKHPLRKNASSKAVKPRK